jgi:NO-binding membrane sensor protein with MHYT domain
MFGIIAAILFAIAFIIHVTSTTTSVVFSPLSLTLLGLALLALHLTGIGPARFSSRR